MSALCQGDDGLCTKEAEADGYCDEHHPGPDFEAILARVESAIRPRLKQPHAQLRSQSDVDLVHLADLVTALTRQRDVAVSRLESATPLLARAALDESERRSWEQKIFALQDGLRGWKSVADAAEKKAAEKEGFADIIDAVSAEINAYDRSICGTLIERVKAVIDLVDDDDRAERHPLAKAQWRALAMLYRAVGGGHFEKVGDRWRNETMYEVRRVLELTSAEAVARQSAEDRVLKAAKAYVAADAQSGPTPPISTSQALIALKHEVLALNKLC